MANHTSKITVPAEKTIAEVTTWPDEVTVVIKAVDGNLTLDQARRLAGMLIAAADQAQTLDWVEDGDEFKVVEKTSA